MNARTVSMSLLSVALALSCSLASADPMICDPAMTTPPNEEAHAAGWFQQLFVPSGKPQPFQGAAITDGPDDGCSSSSEARPVAGDVRQRDRNRVID